MMKRILITGGTGLLGKALMESDLAGHEIIATYFGGYDVERLAAVKYYKLDIRDSDGHERLFREFRPEVVIHTASIGSPDYAENNKELTWDINVNGTVNICNMCGQFGAKLVHISSNGVYDGLHAPYAEDAEISPLNYYGVTKLESERAVARSQVTAAIVRPMLMYGWPNPFERGNIVTLALSKLAKHETMKVYDDVYANPLYAGSCAETIWQIIKDEQYEVFNIAGKDRVSIYGLISRAVRIFDLDPNSLVPVQQGYFNELVPRPKDTSFCTEKMENRLGVKPLTLLEGLTRMREAGACSH
jgi:dTDP-4-dehydrorhamnose reductase